MPISFFVSEIIFQITCHLWNSRPRGYSPPSSRGSFLFFYFLVYSYPKVCFLNLRSGFEVSPCSISQEGSIFVILVLGGLASQRTALKLGRRYTFGEEDGCASSKSHVIVSDGLSVMSLFSLLITGDNALSHSN